jgi:hypothetical protein
MFPTELAQDAEKCRAATLALAFVQVSGGCGIRTHEDASTPQRFSRSLVVAQLLGSDAMKGRGLRSP